MTKTNDELRELRDDEIDGVTGGLVVIAIIPILIGLLSPSSQFRSRGLTNWIEADHEQDQRDFETPHG